MKLIYISLIIVTLLIGIVGAGLTLTAKDITPYLTKAEIQSLKDCGYSAKYQVINETIVFDNGIRMKLKLDSKIKDTAISVKSSSASQLRYIIAKCAEMKSKDNKGIPEDIIDLEAKT